MRDLVLLIATTGFAPLLPILATEDASAGLDWKQFGLVGVTMIMLFWMLKTFMERTLKQQELQTEVLGRIAVSGVNVEKALERLDDRISDHVAEDQRWQQELMRRGIPPPSGSIKTP